MKSLLTRLHEHTTEQVDEGMSITDFNKMMAKFKQSGINFNRMSAQQLMYTLYNTMNKHDFKMLDDKLQQAKDELKKQSTDDENLQDNEDK